MKKILPVVLFHLLSFIFFNPCFSQPFPGKMGVNADGIGGKALEFPNVTLTASRWESIASSGQNASVDAQGWPTEDFRVAFFDHRPYNAWNNAPDDPQKYVVDMSGTYTLSFKGQANLTSWSDAPLQFLNKVYDVPTNTTTVSIVFPPGGGASQAQLGNYGFLMVNFLQTSYSGNIKGIKDIRLMRPGYQHDTPQLFRTSYLNAFSPFSALRFMDYVHTNNSDGGYPNKLTWARRQQAGAPRYSKGAPWETVIALSNYTGRDVWINIPIDADSMYVVLLATLMKNTLRPDVNIYIEYSNEVWNGSFTQYQYNYDAVLQSTEDADIRAGTTADDRRRARRTAKQVIKCGKIFEKVFGITVASRTRIRPVFAWQIGGWLPWYNDVLDWINTTYGAPKNFIYAIASAPYFNEAGMPANADPQQVVAAMSVSSDANVSRIKTLAELAHQWQLKHLQYEGGPDNGGGSTVNIGNRILANRTPEMKTAVIHNYADNWFSTNANGTAPAGTNDLAMYFVMSGGVSRYGCWGATEDLSYLGNLTKAPKYDALCILTGKCGNEPVADLTSPANNTIAIIGNAVTLSATASDPDGSVMKVEFFIGSTLIGTDSVAPYSIQWTPTQEDTVIVLAKAIDNHGKYTFDDGNVLYIKTTSTGMEEIKDEDITVYPNPTRERISILNSSRQTVSRIIWTDVLGRYVDTVVPELGLSEISISAPASGGIYFMRIYTSGERFITKKVVVYE